MASPERQPIHRSSSVPEFSHRNPRNRKGSLRSSATLSSVLTEERLRDHRRNNAASSPYYRGLTDSGLYLRSLGLSPGRESVASSTRSVSSSVLLAIQDWVPFFFFKKKKDGAGGKGEGVKESKTPPVHRRVGSWDPGSVPPRDESKTAEKPLRESYPVPALPAMERASVAPPPTGSADGGIGGGMGKNGESTAAVKERKYLWAHKYRPRALKEFICHQERVEELLEMVNTKECHHLLIEGPAGVGKRTMSLALLRDVYGPEKLKMKLELKKIELKEEPITSIDVNVRISSQHVEVKLSELRGYEKHVIAALINESHDSSNKVVHCDHTNCRVIILHEADKLSTESQRYVRWLMEKYNGCNKIFFCCSDASKLQTMRRLCKIVKLQQPSDNEIMEVLKFIAKKEHIDLPQHIAAKIAKNSKHNLRQAIRSFEASWKSGHSFKEDQGILTGWEEDIANIAKSIVEEQSPKRLYIIRGKLKKLIEHDVSADYIFNILILELKKLLDDQLQAKVDALYQEYKIRDNISTLDAEKYLALSPDIQEVNSSSNFDDQRKIVHHFMIIEEFTAKFMSFYKSIITKGVGGATCC